MTQTLETLDLLAEAGVRYIGDPVYDDEPTTIRTKHGPLVTWPYNFETHDIEQAYADVNDRKGVVHHKRRAHPRLVHGADRDWQQIMSVEEFSLVCKVALGSGATASVEPCAAICLRRRQSRRGRSADGPRNRRTGAWGGGLWRNIRRRAGSLRRARTARTWLQRSSSSVAREKASVKADESSLRAR